MNKKNGQRKHCPQVRTCAVKTVQTKSVKKVSAIFVVETTTERTKTLRKYEQQRAELYSMFE